MYQLLNILNLDGSPIQYIKRLSDCATIPTVEGNTDYQEYLRWLEEGNTPLPADEPEAA